MDNAIYMHAFRDSYPSCSSRFGCGDINPRMFQHHHREPCLIQWRNWAATEHWVHGSFLFQEIYFGFNEFCHERSWPGKAIGGILVHFAWSNKVHCCDSNIATNCSKEMPPVPVSNLILYLRSIIESQNIPSMEFKQKCQGQTDYVSNLGEIATSKFINEPHAIAKDKADYHLLVIFVFGGLSWGRAYSSQRTRNVESFSATKGRGFDQESFWSYILRSTILPLRTRQHAQWTHPWPCGQPSQW